MHEYCDLKYRIRRQGIEKHLSKYKWIQIGICRRGVSMT